MSPRPGPSGQGHGSGILAVTGSIPRPRGRKITTFDEKIASRGSTYDHFPPIGLARGATRNSFFRKEFRTCRSRFLENDRKLHEMASKRRSRGPDTGNLHEISIRIQWRWSRTPKSGFWGLPMDNVSSSLKISKHELSPKPAHNTPQQTGA